MLQSMTAFGQAVTTAANVDICWEIRSVNHRYLDINTRLPKGLQSIDVTLRERCSAGIHRGKVDITLTIGHDSDTLDRLVVNQNLLRQLSEAIDKVQSIRIDAGRCDPVALLQWPGMINVHSVTDDAVVSAALDSFDSALEDFLKARSREGGRIAVALQERASGLSGIVATLREHRPGVVKRQREKLLGKLAQLELEHDAARLEQELVYAAQRFDIDEELDRLDAHLVEFSHIMDRTEAVGRRLDFLMQELNREANTVASKSSDTVTTAFSIDMKVLIEQMREQVQNVE